MTLINQIIAITDGARSRADRDLTDAYQALQKDAPLSGLARTYTPKDEEGDRLPPEAVQVQTTVDRLIATITNSQSRLLDVTFTRDIANTGATADVVVGGQVLISDAPVTFLLTMEAWLKGMRAFIAKLPVLDPAEVWTHDPTTGVYRSETNVTTRTKKIPRAFEAAAATDRHPAQVTVFHEDVIVGTWALTKFSGRIPADRQIAMLARVDLLVDAVKMAREKANSAEVADFTCGPEVLGYLFG